MQVIDKELMMEELVIKNKKVLNFYNKYSSLDFEEVNIMFVDLFERVLNNANGVIDNSILTDMLQKLQHTTQVTENTFSQIQNIKDIHQLSSDKQSTDITNIQGLLNQMSTKMSDNSNVMKNEISTSIISHFQERDFSSESMEKINSIVESQFNSYMDKTKLFYAEKLPSMLDTSNKSLIQTFTASEERINSSLSEIREKSVVNTENTSELKQTINDHILSTKTSSRKGDLSENKLLPILSQIFPTDDIIHNGSGKQAHCCDYSIIRSSNKNILVENKDYIGNIGPDNIKKFIDDIERNNCHGIFISQQSGISGKENYKIDIHKGNVLVYLHNVNYDGSKIRAAVEIIDQLSERLNEIDLDENSISKDDLDTINVEFNNFIESKENIIKMVNDFQKRVVTSIKQLNLSCLEKYLTNKYAHMKSFDFLCEYCNKGWDSRRALAAHKKACQKAHVEKQSIEIAVETINM